MKNIAVITGVGREMGLGFETAKQMIAKGFDVIITARDLTKVSAFAQEIGAIAKVCDVTNDASVKAFTDEVGNEYAEVDVLINNAGGFFDAGGDILATDMHFVQQAFDTNVLGAWRMIKALYPLLMKSEHPRIVNLSSGAASYGDPVFGLAHHFSKVPAYGVTKLALNGLTVKMATQFKDSKIKINAVDPGFTATYPGTEQYGARPVADGAKGIVWAATLADDGPSGGFFRDGEPLPW
jgi:NAD(P)-dependent dehydrogenase (short-subunit alcohol dehydrogenase family)